jgi:DNA polymerase III epsilon subunit-like protein
MTKRNIKSLIFVDCEANGKSPSTGKLTEFGAVAYPSRETFHGVLVGEKAMKEKEVFEEFEKWVLQVNDAMGNLEAFERLSKGER